MEKGKEKKKAEELMNNADFALDLMLGIEKLAKELISKHKNMFPEASTEKAKVFCYCLIEGALANISSNAEPLAKNI